MTDRRNTGRRTPLGGVIHSYQRFDPASFPSPTQPAPDVASAAMEHMLRFGSARRLTPEELADAIHIDPSQIAGLGPSLDSLIAMLEERKRRILERFETRAALQDAAERYRRRAAAAKPGRDLADLYEGAVRHEQLRDLEALYHMTPSGSPFARALMGAIGALGDKYQVEALDGKYTFTGRTPMDTPKALEVKEELETIDRLLEQLREARKNAKLTVIDMEELARFAEAADIEQMEGFRQQLEDYLRQMAEAQGVEQDAAGEYRLAPKAYRLFQSKILQEIFADLEASRSGRHGGPVLGEGAVESQKTRPYEFGDSPANMDVPQTVINAVAREGMKGHRQAGPLRAAVSDIEIHRTRNTPRCASVVIMDMSGSMRYGGQYINAKRMALALDGLIRSEYPGDSLRFVEMYTVAKVRHISEVPELMPKPVTLYDPIVRLKADMSDPAITEWQIPPHFTNIQHALRLARQLLAPQDTPNRQITLLTDGLPTAHFEGEMLYLLYPPDGRTEEATMREALACAREGITINIFLLPNWSQSSEDIQFAQRMAQASGGRVFFTAGDDVDRFVLWDYVAGRRKLLG